ncbi:MAG: ubiquinol-cytochrome c reductase iron-sulfur subunit [Chloroflexi bacterium]|nr:ubiquinol-cytochrome c reductase iron-sulfur subunit [Chloroflexota bacterium]
MSSPAAPSPAAHDAESRRTFLAQIVGACIAFAATLIGLPAIGAVVGPILKRDEASWLSVGDPASFRTGVPRAVNLSIVFQDGWVQSTQVKTVWVVAQPAGSITVFNGRCTHLGCAYSWQSGGSQFICPCHGGIYSLDGNVLAGPPPRPLDALQTRIQNGVLQVQYQDFRLGVPEKASA